METPDSNVTDPSGHTRIVHVTVGPAGKLLPYLIHHPSPEVGMAVVVETERGPQLGVIAATHHPLEAGIDPSTLIPVFRLATPDDHLQVARFEEREHRTAALCLDLIRHHDLDMKLIRVQYLIGGQKAIFYFTAEGRVDFRGLVKDLAHELRIRVEMRQIGVRDETRMLGGVGHCGLELCCSTWLRDFVPVSIRMAKDQNLALNPQKVSGACGRLLCCLAYEHETYIELKRDLPKPGRRVNTGQGPGRIISQEVLQQRVAVELDDGGRLMVHPDELLPGVPPPPESEVSGPDQEDAETARDLRVRRYSERIAEGEEEGEDITLRGLRAPRTSPKPTREEDLEDRDE